MISRHVKCEPKNDDYRRLAQYIADADHKGEKCLLSWCAGCWAGEDEYQLAVKEVEDTQALNTRTTKEKTYHLIVSFRAEDEVKLTPEVFREIEFGFAQVLGFEEHQRHCGVHKNTDNLHLHIAYNQIHPVKRTRHEPYRDFGKRDELCRRIEVKYGLTPDNGRDPGKETVVNDAAQAFEAHTGQESFLSYTQRHKSDILVSLTKALDWSTCHQVFLKFGLCLKPHGNGMIIQSHDGKHSIKASSFDRSISKSRLEKRFGLFKPLGAEIDQSRKPLYQYTAAPIQKEPDRNGLYQQFQAGLKKRKSEMDSINQQEKRIYGLKCQEWERQYQKILKMPMLRKDRQRVMATFKEKKRKELTALRLTMKDQREKVKKRYPYANWSQFLKGEAQRGNEAALAILRSKKDKAMQEIPQAKAESQTHLSVVTKVAEIIRGEGINGGRYRIDGKGTVIFTLPSGGTIRDNGKEIHFSAQDEQAKAVAEKLAKLKWGNNAQLDGGVLKSKSLSYTPIRKAPTQGLSR